MNQWESITFQHSCEEFQTGWGDGLGAKSAGCPLQRTVLSFWLHCLLTWRNHYLNWPQSEDAKQTGLCLQGCGGLFKKMMVLGTQRHRHHCCHVSSHWSVITNVQMSVWLRERSLRYLGAQPPSQDPVPRSEYQDNVSPLNSSHKLL